MWVGATMLNEVNMISPLTIKTVTMLTLKYIMTNVFTSKLKLIILGIIPVLC